MAFDSVTSFVREANAANLNETPPGNELEIVKRTLAEPSIPIKYGIIINEIKAEAEKNTIKSSAESDEFREEGNRLIKANKKANALAASRSYTKAILSAPKDSPALALAHANRAVALIEFGNYLDAYYDCKLALELGYPKENRAKVIMRQANCAIHLKDYFKLEEALDKLRDMKLNPQLSKQREEFEVQLKVKAELPGKWHQDKPHDYKVQNILKHPEKGRYMATWKDYKKDDVVLSEQAFAFVPVENVVICSNCAKQHFIPYSCYTCSKAVYCSPDCKLAHEKIHLYECLGSKVGFFECLGLTYLAIDTLIRGLPDIISELEDCGSAQQIWDKIQVVGKSRRKGYPEILSLYNHLELHSKETVRVLALGSILGAAYLTLCTTFPELYKKSSCSSETWMAILSALILRHTLQMSCNAQSSVAVLHKTYECPVFAPIWSKPMHLEKGVLHGFKNIDVTFAGIYPYLSLCNHSCEQSLSLNFNGNRLIAKSRGDLPKGAEVFNSYILDCRNSTKDCRDDVLQSAFHFECDCKHCKLEDVMDQEFLKFHKYKCWKLSCNAIFSTTDHNIRWWLKPSASVECPKCKTPLELNWYTKFERIFEKDSVNTAEMKEALRWFKYTEKVVHGFSELRSHMATTIVTSFFLKQDSDKQFDEDFSTEIAEVLKYWLDHIEQQNDVESVIYATTAAFALDLMANGKGKSFDFDMKKIRKSFDILSTELKIIFENYIKDYIEDIDEQT